MNKRLLLSVSFLIFGQVLFSQVRYGLSVNTGMSNLYELNQSYVYDENGYRIEDSYQYNGYNYFTSNSAFEITGFVARTIKQSPFSVESGISIGSASYNYKTPEIIFSAGDTIHSNSWVERYWSVGIPLKMNYNIEKWLNLNVGLSNIFNVYEDNEIIMNEPNWYTLRGEAGVDFLLFSKFIVGAKYAHDITPFTKLDNYDVSYRFEIISLKLGYYFK